MKSILEAYEPLQKAYDYFNAILFAGILPGLIVTLQRSRGARGYFSPSRFVQRTEAPAQLETLKRVDELALNPDYFYGRTDLQILSTLAHEMAHVWQEHHGTPGKGAYHNTEWADKMESIGLMPSATGEPGGNRTGRSMTHYIIDGGAFDVAAKKLIGDGLKLQYEDVIGHLSHGPAAGAGFAGGSGQGVATAPAGSEMDGYKPKPKHNRSRTVYHCACGTSIAGKPDLRIKCLDCDQEFQPK